MYPAVAVDPILAALLKGKARTALDGVGDASLGEWIETGRTAVHLRRRLSDAEVEAARPTPRLDWNRCAGGCRRAGRRRNA